MKKNDLILLLSVIIYSWMFYQQSAGLNFLIFTFALIVGLLALNKTLIKDAAWITSATCSVITAVAVFYYGSRIAVVSNFISISLMSALSVSRGASVFSSLFFSLYSYVTSIGFMFVDLIDRNDRRNKDKTNRRGMKLLMWIVIIFIVLFFFFLYQKANPLFRNLTEKINLDFITLGWIFFTFFGFILLYGFYYHRNIACWYNKEKICSDNLNQESISNKEIKFFGKTIDLYAENKAGTILFVLLNILLLIVNVLDIVYLWSGGGLPEGMTYAEFVRQGTGTLIFSILIAIALILYIFRGQQNFFENNKVLVYLALLWIIQNAFMAVSTANRNLLYVAEYNLTYKRIGVLFYLLLAVIGLLFTFIKIKKRKNNLYLFRKNGWAFYLVLVFAALFNWPGIVTRYNISHSKELDKQYLINLSYANLPYLAALEVPETDFTILPDNNDVNYENNYFMSRYRNMNSYNISYYNDNFSWTLHSKLYNFLSAIDSASWRSLSINKINVYKRLLEMHNEGKFKTLILRKQTNIEQKTNLNPFAKFVNVEALDFGGNKILKFEGLNNFTNLKVLSLSNNQLSNVKDFPYLPILKELYLSANSISTIDGLLELPALEVLDVSRNNNISIVNVNKIENLVNLNISDNTVSGLKDLSKAANLKHLTMRNMHNNNFRDLTPINSLNSLDISYNNLSSEDFYLVYILKNFPSLKTINISSNRIGGMFFTSKYFKRKNYDENLDRESINNFYARLENIDFSSNNIYSLYGAEQFVNVSNLNLSVNSIDDIEPLYRLNKLQILNLSNNKIKDINGIESLTYLSEIYLSFNNISDITALSLLQNLTRISVSDNQISVLPKFKTSNSIVSLDVHKNKITDIKNIQYLKNLEYLDVSDNPISSFTPLYNLKNLKTLKVSNISEKQLVSLKSNLPDTEIIKQEEPASTNRYYNY